jgi:hypothetical protein
LDVEDRIGGVSLRKNDLVLAKFQYGFALADLGEKELWIKWARYIRHEILSAGYKLSGFDTEKRPLSQALSPLRWRVQTSQPARYFPRFHRIDKLTHALMNAMASGDF